LLLQKILISEQFNRILKMLNEKSLIASASRSSQTYILVTAFMSLFAIVGFAYYGLPFFYDFMTKEFGWSRAVVTSGNAVGKLLVGPLFGFFAGYLIDRYGPRKLMMSGALMAGVALIGLAFSNSLGMFYTFCIFNALGYVFGGPLPCQVIVSRWFDNNRGKAMGIAYLGIGVGGALAPLISAGLEKNHGWHIALMSLVILVILIAFPFAFFIKDSQKERIEMAKNEAFVPIKDILKNPNFYLLSIGSLLSIGAVGGISQHLKYYLRDISFTQAEASHIMSIVLISSLGGRVLMGFLADLISRKYVMLMLFIFVAASIPILLMPEFSGRIYIFAIIFGIGLGGNYMIIPLMAGDLFGIKALGRTMGIILVADGIAEAVFPMLVGALYGSTKSYVSGFIILITATLIGAIIISFLPKTNRIQKV
jgi:MFS family permease